jgi:hypothetical protein
MYYAIVLQCDKMSYCRLSGLASFHEVHIMLYFQTHALDTVEQDFFLAFWETLKLIAPLRNQGKCPSLVMPMHQKTTASRRSSIRSITSGKENKTSQLHFAELTKDRQQIS